MAAKPSNDYIPGVIEGRPLHIARLISRAEAGSEECREALSTLFQKSRGAHVVGITGVPGSGKSTLVAELVKVICDQGRKVAIIAIDPTSPFSGGSILGDRIRMSDVAMNPNVFIRSMATRGSLGGLSKASFDAVDVLDAAGFDLVIIETVGVGQDEVEIVQAAHSVVVVSAPGLGDDIQAIKAGILEIADIHVVSKADKPDADDTIRSLKGMLMLEPSARERDGWTAPVIPTSAPRGDGIEDLLGAIDAHREFLKDTGQIERRARAIAELRVIKTAEEIVRSRFEARRNGALSGMLDRVVARKLAPYSAAHELLTALNEE